MEDEFMERETMIAYQTNQNQSSQVKIVLLPRITLWYNSHKERN